MYDPIETIIYKKHTISIYTDDDPIDPRKDRDNLWKMLCSHRNYDLGDWKLENYGEDFEHDFAIHIAWIYETGAKLNDYWDWFETEKDFDTCQEYIQENIARQKLYLMDHSWISMSCWSFWCPRDSGQVWYIFAHKDDICKRYQEERSKELMKKAENALIDEVKVYNDYLTWNVYGYIISGEHCDHSCRGYYSSSDKRSERFDDIIQDAKSNIDAGIKYDMNKHIQIQKEKIKNKVPLEYRKSFV